MGCEGPPLVSPTWDISTRGGKTMTYRWWLKGISTDLGLKHVWIHIGDRQVVSSSFFILSLGLAIDFFWFQLFQERMQLIPTFQSLFPRGWGLQAVATCWAHRWKLQFWSQKRACSLAMLAMLGRGSSDHGDGLYLIYLNMSFVFLAVSQSGRFEQQWWGFNQQEFQGTQPAKRRRCWAVVAYGV